MEVIPLPFSQAFVIQESNIILFSNLRMNLYNHYFSFLNPFAPEPPVTARADPGPFYPL